MIGMRYRNSLPPEVARELDHILASLRAFLGISLDSSGEVPELLDHSTRHENGGADEIDVTGLTGLLATAQTPAVHATSHAAAGSDPVIVNLTNQVSGDLPLANLAQGTALSVLGVAGNVTADEASIVAGSDHQVLRRSGTAVGFGAVNLAQAAAVTGDLPLANLTPASAISKLLGRGAGAGAGDFEEITLGTGLSMSGTTLSASAGSGDVTKVGTPANDQVGVWTGDGTIEGATGLTYDGTTLTIPGQIAFPATQAASSGANVLDDYEEGSWTPVVGGSGGTTGQTYDVQVGRYVKIGRQVTAWGYVDLSAKGTITGSAQVQGLPFTTENTANVLSGGHVTYYSGFLTAWSALVFYMNPNVSAADIYTVAAGGATGMNTPVAADIGNNLQMTFTVTYRATA